MLRFDVRELLARNGAALGLRVQNAEQGFAKPDRPRPYLGRGAGRCRAGPAKPGRLAAGECLRSLEPVDQVGKAGDPLGAGGPPSALPGIAEIEAQGSPRAAKRFRVGLALGALKGGRSGHRLTFV